MPIHMPGKRDRHNKMKKTGRRIVAGLSLTAMVDMFTVLTIFLLQFDIKTQLVQTPKDVTLPKATETKELKPAHVVTISGQNVMLDDAIVAKFSDITASQDWMVTPLYQRLRVLIQDDLKQRQGGLRNTLQKAVRGGKRELTDEELGKVTVQADKEIDFVIIKKIMYTVTEAGALEINFAVTKMPHEKAVN